MKTECKSCGQHIEYKSNDAGKSIECPSCSSVVSLPETKIDGNHLATFLVVLIGVGFLLAGLEPLANAKTIFQQIYGAIYISCGCVLLSLALVINILTNILKNQSRN